MDNIIGMNQCILVSTQLFIFSLFCFTPLLIKAVTKYVDANTLRYFKETWFMLVFSIIYTNLCSVRKGSLEWLLVSIFQVFQVSNVNCIVSDVRKLSLDF